MASYTVFADESGTRPPYACYGIGALVLPTPNLERFNDYAAAKRLQHGVTSELKWTKIGTSHGAINFAVDLLRDVLRSTARFSVIVVHKGDYNRWREDNEEGFYLTYTMLIAHRAKTRPGSYEVFIDNRSDEYVKRLEAMQIITNRMIVGLPGSSEVTNVEKADSKVEAGLQAVDLLTGAITAAHNLTLTPASSVNAGKRLLIARLAATLGWSDLHFDTRPDSPFNIWHFPQETWRAKPASLPVTPNLAVPYVTREELENAIRSSQP